MKLQKRDHVVDRELNMFPDELLKRVEVYSAVLILWSRYR